MSGSNGSPRVAITGIGAVTPLGLDAESTWQSCRRGQGGIGRSRPSTPPISPPISPAEVKGFDPEAILGKKESRRMSRCTQLAIFAARQAIEDSGLDIRPMAEDVGVLVASGVGGIEVIERNVLALYNQGPRRVSPFTVPSMIIDMPAGAIAIDCGAKGVNYAIIKRLLVVGARHRRGGGVDPARRGDGDHHRWHRGVDHQHQRRRLRRHAGAVDPQRRARPCIASLRQGPRRLRDGRRRGDVRGRGMGTCRSPWRADLR